MAQRAAIGIIGCGNISETYFRLAPLFRGLKIVACADIVPAAAKARAEQYSASRAMTVDELLKSDEIDIVINLTVPGGALRRVAGRSCRRASTPIRRSRWR